jgi:hypothetical protein
VIFHYAATALIGFMFLWHFRSGGRANSLRILRHDRDKGLNNLTDDGHQAVYTGVVVTLLLSALVLLVPQSPIWLEGTQGVLFVIFAFADFFVQKGKKLGGYFAAAIGVLIFAGILS